MISKRLNERKMQIKSVGYAAILGGQHGSGSQSGWDDFEGVGSVSGLGSGEIIPKETKLSEDLGDLNVNKELAKPQEQLVDDIFA